MIISSALITGLFLLSVGAFQSDDVSVVASSPETVHPLLPGMQSPDATVRDLRGDPVSIREVTARKPTVLVFYRGGW